MKKINEHIKPSKQIIVGRQDSLAGKGTQGLALQPEVSWSPPGGKGQQLLTVVLRPPKECNATYNQNTFSMHPYPSMFQSYP